MQAFIGARIERAPPSQYSGCTVYICIYRTSSARDQLLNTCTVYAVLVPRSKLSFPGLHLRGRDVTCGDSLRGLYGLPGRSIERSQASSSNKLAGSSVIM